MTSRDREAPPQRLARTGGAIYLLIIALALFGEMASRDGLIVRGDATATANNLLAAQTLFRAGVAGELLTCLGDTVLALILYRLLRPAGRNLALLAAFFRVAFVAVYAVAKLPLLAAIGALADPGRLAAFEPQQLHALAYFALRLHDDGYGVALLFFGCACVLLGWLVHRSSYLPRIIGLLLIAGGAGYLVNSFARVLAPAFAGSLFPWILLPAFVAESALALWLLAKGVDAAGWEARARPT